MTNKTKLIVRLIILEVIVIIHILLKVVHVPILSWWLTDLLAPLFDGMLLSTLFYFIGRDVEDSNRYFYIGSVVSSLGYCLVEYLQHAKIWTGTFDVVDLIMFVAGTPLAYIFIKKFKLEFT